VGERSHVRATGRCLCGAVVYEIVGPLRDIMLCHCEECRRWSGYLGAFTSTRVEDLVIRDDRALRWIDSPRSDRRARRGFCSECGSNLFWQSESRERINIGAGTLDRPTGLRIAGHWYAHHTGDYDELPDDGLPHGGEALRDIRWS
jgi:hypothetical protein